MADNTPPPVAPQATVQQAQSAMTWRDIFAVLTPIVTCVVGVLATFAIAFGSCTANQILTEVREIQNVKIEVAKVQPLSDDFKTFETEMRNASTATDNRLDGISVQVATLTNLPQQVAAATTEFNNAKDELLRTSSDARVAAAGMAATTSEITSIKSSVGKAEAQLNLLASLPGKVDETRKLLDELSKSGTVKPRTSSIAEIALRNGSIVEKPQTPEGFILTEIEYRSEEIPLLADRSKWPVIGIDSAHVLFRGEMANAPIPMIEPRLGPQGETLKLILWWPKTVQKPPDTSEGYYARFNVSWPAGF